MGQVGTRKRPAPGTSPLIHSQHQKIHDSTPSPMRSKDQQMGWQPTMQTGATNNYIDPNIYATQYSNNGLSRMAEQAQTQYPPTATQIAIRAPDQHLIPTQNYSGAGSGAWAVAEDETQAPSGDVWPMQYDDLDQRAIIAKRDAQAKRKQIPPFIQKLSSFLDESRNTDLIRWSDSGDSFIVVDEDEFAKTLIPELFKHNNYASFVRQLNMYGFHKKVGLSHNSMRASERKNKDPSEYSNPYFRRGRPNLLWLIQKPKNPQGKGVGKGGGRTKQEDFDEDIDETFGRDNSPMPLDQETLETGTGMHGRQQSLLTMGNMTARLPQDEMASLRQELQTVQRNQNMIREMLNQTRREHAQLYGQAKAFHELHEKHDNSINAILTFLATVYNKNLASGREGSGDMFPGAIPPNDQPHGEIVDMGDEKYQEHNGHQHYRREPLLIEDGRATSNSPSGAGNLKPRQTSTSKGKYRSFGKNQPMHSPQILELSDRASSNRSSESPQIKPSDNNQMPKADIMSMINSAIARDSSKGISGARMEFPEALSHLQNADGQTPLTPNQRDNMLQLMANEHPANSPNNTNNALSYPSASPIPNQADLNFTNDQLNQIQQSLREQDERMANIQNTIAPLSPSGSIPDINDGGAYSGPNGQDMLDLDQIFNSGDYFNDGGPVADLDFDGADLPDFDFGTAAPVDETQAVDDGDADAGGGRVVGSIDSSEATSPANTIDSCAAAAPDTTSCPRQRRRRA